MGVGFEEINGELLLYLFFHLYCVLDIDGHFNFIAEDFFLPAGSGNVVELGSWEFVIEDFLVVSDSISKSQLNSLLSGENISIIDSFISLILGNLEVFSSILFNMLDE